MACGARVALSYFANFIISLQLILWHRPATWHLSHVKLVTLLAFHSMPVFQSRCFVLHWLLGCHTVPCFWRGCLVVWFWMCLVPYITLVGWPATLRRDFPQGRCLRSVYIGLNVSEWKDSLHIDNIYRNIYIAHLCIIYM